MKIVSDQKKIKRYGKIGLYTSLASLILLFAAVIITLLKPEYTSYAFIAMLAGLILSQIGVFFANRWGKSPRVDEALSQGLKGLDDRYTLYHYMTPVPHLLAGPTGLWVIVPEYQGGAITYENKRYRQQGIRIMSRLIGQEGLGNPESEARSYKDDLVKFVQKALPEEQQPPIQTVIVFTNPKASVQAQEAPVPTMHVEKLKDFIRRKLKEESSNAEKVREVTSLLPKEDIV